MNLHKITRIKTKINQQEQFKNISISVFSCYRFSLLERFLFHMEESGGVVQSPSFWQMVRARANVGLGDRPRTRWAQVRDKPHTANLAHHQTTWQLSEGNNYRSKVLYSHRFENEMKLVFPSAATTSKEMLITFQTLSFVPTPLRNLKQIQQTDIQRKEGFVKRLSTLNIYLHQISPSKRQR